MCITSLPRFHILSTQSRYQHTNIHKLNDLMISSGWKGMESKLFGRTTWPGRQLKQKDSLTAKKSTAAYFQVESPLQRLVETPSHHQHCVRSRSPLCIDILHPSLRMPLVASSRPHYKGVSKALVNLVLMLHGQTSFSQHCISITSLKIFMGDVSNWREIPSFLLAWGGLWGGPWFWGNKTWSAWWPAWRRWGLQLKV